MMPLNDELIYSNFQKSAIGPEQFKAIMTNPTIKTMILDCQSPSQYSKKHIHQAIPICVPLTFLKRPSFHMNKLVSILSNEICSRALAGRHGYDIILVYDYETSIADFGSSSSTYMPFQVQLQSQKQYKRQQQEKQYDDDNKNNNDNSRIQTIKLKKASTSDICKTSHSSSNTSSCHSIHHNHDSCSTVLFYLVCKLSQDPCVKDVKWLNGGLKQLCITLPNLREESTINFYTQEENLNSICQDLSSTTKTLDSLNFSPSDTNNSTSYLSPPPLIMNAPIIDSPYFNFTTHRLPPKNMFQPSNEGHYQNMIHDNNNLHLKDTFSLEIPNIPDDEDDLFVGELEKWKTPGFLRTVVEIPDGLQLLQIRWKELSCQEKAMTKDFSISDALEYLDKNRFHDIFPYNHNRVHLKTTIPNYIHATKVKLFNQEYIASQAPLPQTTHSFWQMVYEQKVEIIVMLSKDLEPPIDYKDGLKGNKNQTSSNTGKEAGIFDEEQGNKGVDENKEVPNYLTVDVGTEIQRSKFIARKLKITVQRKSCKNYNGSNHNNWETRAHHEKEYANVFLIQYRDWKDHQVPPSCAEFIQFLDLVKMMQTENPNPILVYCLAGCGRTGVFITMHGILSALYKSQLRPQEPENDQQLLLHSQQDIIYQSVLQLRKQRMHMVQTFNQFLFLYETLWKWYLLKKECTMFGEKSILHGIKKENKEIVQTFMSSSSE